MSVKHHGFRSSRFFQIVKKSALAISPATRTPETAAALDATAHFRDEKKMLSLSSDSDPV
jgi:hypothetical protein